MKRVLIVVFAALTAAFILRAGECAAQGALYRSIEDSVPTISVQGEGKATVRPDEADARFGVTSEDKLLGTAYRLNTEDMNSVIKALKIMGVKEDDIKTSSYNIRPVYPKDDRGRQLPGRPVSYKVSQDLTVKIRALSDAGKVVDTAVRNGANTFSGISFTSSRLNELKKEAKAKAALDASEKALLLTKKLGVSTGRILKVSESAIRPLYDSNRSFGAMEMSAKASAPQIEAGSLEVAATCNIIYEIIQ